MTDIMQVIRDQYEHDKALPDYEEHPQMYIVRDVESKGIQGIYGTRERAISAIRELVEDYNPADAGEETLYWEMYEVLPMTVE